MTQAPEPDDREKYVNLLWDSLNMIQDFSEKSEGDYHIIHQAVSIAQEAANKLNLGEKP